MNFTEAWVCRQKAPEIPDFLVISCGLWHMLHVTDAADFASGMDRLREASLSLARNPRTVCRSPERIMLLMHDHRCTLLWASR